VTMVIAGRNHIWHLRVIGHTDMRTDTAVTVDASSDHPPMIGAGPDSPARSRQIRQPRGVDALSHLLANTWRSLRLRIAPTRWLHFTPAGGRGNQDVRYKSRNRRRPGGPTSCRHGTLCGTLCHGDRKWRSLRLRIAPTRQLHGGVSALNQGLRRVGPLLIRVP
jgi:hypothetical protein